MRHKLSGLFLGFVLLISASTFLTACNTVHGAGEDLERSSDKVERHM